MKFRYVILIGFLAVAAICSGQNTTLQKPLPNDSISNADAAMNSTSTSDPLSYIPPSPGAADLGKAAAVEVGMFTGTAQFSVQLYTFKTPEFTIPLTLNYSSNGLKVDEMSSWVGHGWTLNVGGVISRYKKGLVDKPGFRPAFPNWQGMTDVQKYDFCSSVYSRAGDVEPDIFTFSFLNYSGKFVFDENGLPRLIPFINLKIETNSAPDGTYTFFKITAPDGIIYRFSDLETASPVTEPSFPTSWMLTSIVHPTGDSITFTYDYAYQTHYIGVSQNVSVRVAVSGASGPGFTFPSSVNNENIVYSHNSVCVLKEINFHGYGKVIFEKSADRADAADYKLNRIVVKDYLNNQIKTFQLVYKFKQNYYLFPIKVNDIVFSPPVNQHNYRMFLDSVKFFDNTDQRILFYKFDYNASDSLPARFSYAQDHWGYFNGRQNEELVQINDVPAAYRNLFLNLISGICSRKPDFRYSKKGMLNKITFPSGGYTTIEYEGHKNSAGVELGGCRVLRTKSYHSASSPPLIKKYLYSSSVYSSDTIYYVSKDYYFNYSVPPTVYSGSYTMGNLSSNSIYNVLIDGKYHVIYTKVEVLDGENGENGKSVHYFDYNADSPGTPINGQMIIPMPRSNSFYESGTPVLIENFDMGMNLKSKESFSYIKELESRNKKQIRCMAIDKRPHPEGILATPAFVLQFFDVVPYNINSGWNYVSLKEVVNYEGIGNVLQTTNYFYDDSLHAQLSREITADCLNQSIIRKYYYPHNYGAVFNTLKNNYMIALPVDTRTYVNNQLVSGKQVRYNVFGQVNEVYNFESASNDVPFSSSNPFTFSNKQIISYNIDKNPEKVDVIDNVKTYYLWAYNKQYPVAKMESNNNSLNISSLQSNLNNLTLSGSSVKTNIDVDIANIKNVITQSNLSANMVTIYTFKPLVGMTSQTDPAGRTTYYEYDTFNRLELSRDQNGNIIEKYDYHYANH